MELETGKVYPVIDYLSEKSVSQHLCPTLEIKGQGTIWGSNEPDKPEVSEMTKIEEDYSGFWTLLGAPVWICVTGDVSKMSDNGIVNRSIL